MTRLFTEFMSELDTLTFRTSKSLCDQFGMTISAPVLDSLALLELEIVFSFAILLLSSQ